MININYGKAFGEIFVFIIKQIIYPIKLIIDKILQLLNINQQVELKTISIIFISIIILVLLITVIILRSNKRKNKKNNIKIKKADKNN